MRKLLLTATGFVGFVASASAQTIMPALVWARLPYWTIASDPNQGNGCFMETTYSNNTKFRIGTNMTSPESAYLSIRNPAWASMVAGRSVTLEISVDGLPYKAWTGEVTPMSGSEPPALYMQTSNLKTVGAFATASILSIRYQGQMLIDSDVLGGKEAAQSLVMCQVEHAPRASDPFQSSTSDPFKQ